MGYLCERTPFLEVLKLRHPSLEDVKAHVNIQESQQGQRALRWTAWDVCEGEDLWWSRVELAQCGNWLLEIVV